MRPALVMSKCSFIALYIFSSLFFRDDHYDTSFVVPDEEYVCFPSSPEVEGDWREECEENVGEVFSDSTPGSTSDWGRLGDGGVCSIICTNVLLSSMLLSERGRRPLARG